MSKKSAVNPPTTLLCDRVKVPLSCPVSPQMEGSHPTAEDSSPKGTFLPYFPLTFPCFALPQREATATNLMEESLRYIETQYLQGEGHCVGRHSGQSLVVLPLVHLVQECSGLLPCFSVCLDGQTARGLPMCLHLGQGNEQEILFCLGSRKPCIM